MTLYQALRLVLHEVQSHDSSDNPELTEASTSVREFLVEVRNVLSHADSLEKEPLDTLPLLERVLVDEGVCIMSVCTASEIREILVKKGHEPIARRLSNEKIIATFLDGAKESGDDLPKDFGEWRLHLIWATAKRLAREDIESWAEPKGRRGRVNIVRRKRDDT